MDNAHFDDESATREKPFDETADEEKLASARYIGREAEALQKTAEEHGYEFLSFILRSVVLETEKVLGTQELVQ